MIWSESHILELSRRGVRQNGKPNNLVHFPHRLSDSSHISESSHLCAIKIQVKNHPKIDRMHICAMTRIRTENNVQKKRSRTYVSRKKEILRITTLDNGKTPHANGKTEWIHGHSKSDVEATRKKTGGLRHNMGCDLTSAESQRSGAWVHIHGKVRCYSRGNSATPGRTTVATLGRKPWRLEHTRPYQPARPPSKAQDDIRNGRRQHQTYNSKPWAVFRLPEKRDSRWMLVRT